MEDTCTCEAGEACVAYYDGTCEGGMPTCVPAPAGCEGDPTSCESGCPDLICAPSMSHCGAPPCEDEWPSTVGCYGG